MSDSENETENENENNNNNNNNNQIEEKNEKKNALCLFLQTRKTNKNFNSKHDKKYFDAMEMKDEYKNQNLMGYYVMYAIIPAIFKASDCKDYITKYENKWLQKFIENHKNNKKNKQIIDTNDDHHTEWFAYHLKHVHELENNKPNKGNLNFMNVESSMLEQFKNENPLILQYEKEYNLKYKGLVIDSRMISLIKSGKKKLEYRSTKLASIEYISAVDMDEHLVRTKKKRKKKEILVSVGPNRSNLERVPSRSAIATKPRKNVNLKKAVTGIHKNKRHWPDWYRTERLVWDPKIMSSEMQWVLYKSNDKKNDNQQVREHNNELMNCMTSTIKACNYWRNLLNKRNYNFLLNIADIATTAPEFLRDILIIINSEMHKFPEMRAPIAYIFHLIRPAQCKKCNIECDYQYISNESNTKRGPEYLWVCNQCKWRRSVWVNTIVDRFKNVIKIEGLLLLLYSYGNDKKIKCDAFESRTNKETTAKVRNFFKDIGYIYDRRRTLKLGGNDKYGKPTKTYSDHTHFNKLKYNQGYKKNKKRCILGSTDDTGLITFDRVESERQIETDYFILRQLSDNSIAHTDKGNAFNHMEELFDNVKHYTVNHSGQLDDRTGRITYFKDWVTGIHNNPIEGVFGRFKMWICSHPTIMQGNIKKFEAEMASYKIRFNYGCNYAPQSFWNYLTMISIVAPVYGDWMTMYLKQNKEKKKTTIYKTITKKYKKQNKKKNVALEDFSNVHYVQYIVQKKKVKWTPLYMVKWKRYGHRDNEWLRADQFLNKSTVKEFEKLFKTAKGRKELEKRKKTYERAIAEEKKNATKKQYVAGLSISKIKKHCDNDNDTIVKAQKLIKDDKILKSSLQKNKTRITAEIQSGNVNNMFHRCSVICGEQGNIKSWVCTCLYVKSQKTYVCKHIAAMLIDRCANKKK